MKHTKICETLLEKTILRGDKDSSVAIMNRSHYLEKLEGMIEDGVNLTQERSFLGLVKDEGGGQKRSSLPNIHYTYSAMAKLCTVIPYLEKIRKIYK